MDDDRIEREIVIAAPVERVWALVQRPGFWVADPPDLTDEPVPAGRSVVASSATYGDFPVLVVAAEPPTYCAYRWASAFPGQELTDSNTTLVEFVLTAEGDGTRLRVVESGFRALSAPEDVRTKAREENTGGWPQVLDALRARVAA